jgi:hypothetical protein
MGEYTSLGFQHILWFLKASCFWGRFSSLNVNGLEHIFLYISMAGRTKTSSGNTCLRFDGFTEMSNI